MAINVTQNQQQSLAKLARAANRRLERATEGQRAALDYYLKTYHTREGAHGMVFQQGKAKSQREYNQRMAELKAFMEGETSTRKGWEELKQSNIEKGGDTLRNRGYDITDEELAVIIMETGGKKQASGREFYRALNNVQAARNAKAKKEGDSFTGLIKEEIINAIATRNTEAQAVLSALRSK